MAEFFRTCRDGHRCENGSICKEDPVEEGSYYCDCSTGITDVAGLFCEYEAENYCNFEQEVTSSWFCTNQGTCVVGISAAQSEWKCDCPISYEGPHCEYISGALPSDWPGISAAQKQNSKSINNNNDETDGLETGVMIAIILVSLIVVSLVAFVVVRNRRKSVSQGEGRIDQNAPKDQSEALHIEMDGSVLREAVKSMSSRGSNSNSNTPSIDDQFNFEAGLNGIVEVDNEHHHPSPSFLHQSNTNGNGGGGHGQIL